MKVKGTEVSTLKDSVDFLAWFLTGRASVVKN